VLTLVAGVLMFVGADPNFHPAVRIAALTTSPDSACDNLATFVTGTTKLTAVGKLLRFGSHTPIPDDFAQAVIEAIAEHLVVPSPLTLNVYSRRVNLLGPGKSADLGALFPSFSSEFLIVFRRNGTLKKLSMTQESLAPTIDAAIGRAINAADSARLFPPIAEATKESELTVFIDFDLTGFPERKSFPLFRATVPLYAANRHVSPFSPVQPKYPEELRKHNIEGDVGLMFVVDESGRVVQGAYRLTQVAEEEFGKAVLAVLPQLRYTPARIGSCPVKALVEQSFQFKMER
jgi:hypothetical protein